MKKRLLGTILATAMVFSLTACGTTNETQQAPAAEEEAPAADATENETEESADAATEAAAETATEGEAAGGSVNATVIWRAFDDQFQRNGCSCYLCAR